MNILCAYRDEAEKQYLGEKLAGHTVTWVDKPLHEAEWDGAGVECVTVFISSKVTKEILDRLPDVKLIATRSTGYDHIDRVEAKARGITVASVATYGEHTVSEFAFALLLGVGRHVVNANKHVVEDGAFSPDGFTGFDLAGKTMGVLGTGRIGKNLIKIAKGFSMDVIAYDVYQDTAARDALGFTYLTLDEVYARADIISLHLPELPETHHIINRDSIAKMKRGVVIVNTARGALIDSDALMWGVREGIVAAAGLDVLDEEHYVADESRLTEKGDASPESMKTLIANHALIDHPQVLVTPHIAFNSHEALRRILDTTVDTIDSFARGEKKNVVP